LRLQFDQDRVAVIGTFNYVAVRFKSEKVKKLHASISMI
jgi:hypothetical protein